MGEIYMRKLLKSIRSFDEDAKEIQLLITDSFKDIIKVELPINCDATALQIFRN